MSKYLYSFFLLFLSLPVYANSMVNNGSSGLFDNILKRFAETASQWGSFMISSASWLFSMLAFLSMFWTYAQLALKKADVQEFVGETFRFIMTTGFFLWLLTHGPAISMAIMDSLREVAAKASGLPNNLSPSSIVDIGFEIAFAVIDKFSMSSPIDSAIGILMGIVILVILAWVGVELLLLLIASWILAYAGVFLLGFGGGRWTTDIALNYYRTVLSVGVQIFSMVLLIGIGKSFIDQYHASASDVSLKSMLVLLIASFVLLKLVEKIPPMLGGIVGGSSFGGGGGMSFSAGAAMGAAGVAIAGTQAASGAIASGMISMAGGASAVYSAVKAAQSNRAAEGFQSGGKNASGSGGGLAGAMSTAGRFMADVGANLAKGAGNVLKEKAGSMVSDAKNSLSQTAGGKIASSIHNSLKVSAGHASPKFDGNGVSQGNGLNKNDAKANSEVVDFVNKGRK